MNKEEAIEKILEFIYQHSEGNCPLCGTKDYPVKGDKKGYEVSSSEADEWNLDHFADCPVAVLAGQGQKERPCGTGERQ